MLMTGTGDKNGVRTGARTADRPLASGDYISPSPASPFSFRRLVNLAVCNHKNQLNLDFLFFRSEFLARGRKARAVVGLKCSD